MRILLILTLTLLSGCGLFSGGAPTTGPMADQQFCQRQAENDAAVKEIILKGLGNQVYAAEHQDALKAAKQDATIACLRSRGVIAPGGVERQKPL
jgi:hypothetical protein